MSEALSTLESHGQTNALNKLFGDEAGRSMGMFLGNLQRLETAFVRIPEGTVGRRAELRAELSEFLIGAPGDDVGDILGGVFREAEAARARVRNVVAEVHGARAIKSDRVVA